MLFLEAQSNTDQADLEIIHNSEGDVWEDEFDADTILGCLWSKHPPAIGDVDRITRRLRIVRCALTQRKESNDWRSFSIFKLSLKSVIRIVRL